MRKIYDARNGGNGLVGRSCGQVKAGNGWMFSTPHSQVPMYSTRLLNEIAAGRTAQTISSKRAHGLVGGLGKLAGGGWPPGPVLSLSAWSRLLNKRNPRQ